MCEDLEIHGEAGDGAFPAQAGSESLESPPRSPNTLTQARPPSGLPAAGSRQVRLGRPRKSPHNNADRNSVEPSQLRSLVFTELIAFGY